MNNLYDKIYEAVNTGIQKALIINDGQTEDVSVNFHHMAINGNVNTLNHYVRELINGDDNEYYYNLICEHYKNNQIKYVVKDFDELYLLWNIMYNGLFNTYNLFQWIDLHNVITVINRDGTEQAFTENILIQQNNIEFIKFKNNKTGHDIILHKDLMESVDEMTWKRYRSYNKFDDSNIFLNFGSALGDYNGYEHTYIDDNNQAEEFPAFEFCKNIDIPGYDAYLPALGELSFLYQNYQIVAYVLHHVGYKKPFIDDFMILYWSSTEAGETNVWVYSTYSIDTGSKTGYKRKVLPFFKVKN